MHKPKEKAALSLQWANILTAVFSVLFLLLGGLFSAAFDLQEAAVCALAVGLAADILLTVVFIPPARREAMAETERESAVKRVGRRALFQYLVIGAYLALGLLFVLRWLGGLDTGACLALLPVVGGAYLLAASAAVYARRLFLTTAAERAAQAARLRPRGMNLLSAALILAALLSMQTYRLVWLVTARREDWVSAVTLAAFAAFYVALLILPLIVRRRSPDPAFRRAVRLCGARNFLAAVGLLILNLSFSFLRSGGSPVIQTNWICALLGAVWTAGAIVLFEWLLRRKRAKGKK